MNIMFFVLSQEMCSETWENKYILHFARAGYLQAIFELSLTQSLNNLWAHSWKLNCVTRPSPRLAWLKVQLDELDDKPKKTLCKAAIW